jgi:lipopolysaccharide export system ATP-binding protein
MALRVKNLNQYYGKKKFLDSISFEAHPGKVVAFLGPNGAGKTTLLKSVIGLLPVPKSTDEENIIELGDQKISLWPVSRRVGQGLVYVPQHTSLFVRMSLLDNLKILYHYHPYWHEKSKEEFESEMYRWLKRADLTNSLHQMVGNLSGGQKRKLEVVRSLLLHSQVIMFDEPFAGVDPKSIYELKAIFLDLVDNGMSIIISDHHVDQLLSIAKMFYVIVGGKVICSGGIKDIMAHEYTKTMYLGHQFHSEMLDRYLK